MTYKETIRYLESFINYEKIAAWPYKESLKLERFVDFLSTIGNPHRSLKCIHVAGTKGKGSTCAFISYMLRAAGLTVGLYTSPHLCDSRERVRILSPRSTVHGPQSAVRSPRSKDFEGMIQPRELAHIVEALRPSFKKYNEASAYGALSFFEVYTAIAFIYFKQKKVDFAVLETGLGGRLDATNVAQPLVCAITPISYEHTDKLGSTLAEIAGEKAGIIKESRETGAGGHQVTRSQGHKSQVTPVTGHKLVVITAPQEKEAHAVIRNRCRQTGAELYEVVRDIVYEADNGEFSVQTISRRYSRLKLKLLGGHQIVNASVAVGVIEALRRSYGIQISLDAVRRGLYQTIWPGRCEVVGRRPAIVVDGAQNVASTRALLQAIQEHFTFNNLILVLGISRDKDIRGICKELYGLVHRIVVTKADNPRATRPEDIARYFKGKSVDLTHTVKDARDAALRAARSNDLIVVCGSLFVVGEFRALMRQG